MDEAVDHRATAQPQGRIRFSITNKIIVAVVLLVGVVVALFAILGGITQRRIYDEIAKRARDRGERSSRMQLRALSRRLALALAPALAENNYPYIREVVKRTLADDRNIEHIAIANSDSTIVVDTRAKRIGQKVKELALTSKREQLRTVASKGGAKALLFAAPMMVGEQLQGVIRVRYSLAFLERQLAEYAKERDSTTRRLALRGLLIGGVSLLFGALLSVLVAISITRPIKGLASTASQLARGNLSARTDLATRDELGALGGVLNHMADRLILLVSETAQRARLSKEMEVAAAVQESLVPGPAAISLGLVTLAGFYRPAEVCGGDWWNIFYVDDRRVMIVIGDVTGHGVSSAMLTASAKSACDAMARERGPKLTVLGLMQTLNHVIYQVGRRQLLMTCNITMLDRATGHVEFGSAGHPLPYIVSMQDGQPHLRGLIARGNRLGDRTDWNFKIETDQLQPDDMILWYTDGLTECENPRGEEFGEKRLRNLLVQQMRHNASSARDKLASAADDFYRGKAQADDITFVVGKVERT